MKGMLIWEPVVPKLIGLTAKIYLSINKELKGKWT